MQFPNLDFLEKLQSPSVAYIPSYTRLLLFGTFELAFSKLVNIEKLYSIPEPINGALNQ